MMILIHGDDSVKSLGYLNLLRKDFEEKGYQITAVSGAKLTELDLENLGTGQSLFEEKRLAIVDNFFSTKKNKDLVWPKGLETIFYESEKIFPPKTIGLEVKLFDFEPIVFKFLDSISPGNQKVFLPLFEKYIKSTVPELALTMIVRQFRFMLLSLEKSAENPDDYSRLASWQLAKIKTQAEKFGNGNLVGIYGNLLEIDEDVKTGKPELSLASRLELFLLTL